MKKGITLLCCFIVLISLTRCSASKRPASTPVKPSVQNTLPVFVGYSSEQVKSEILKEFRGWEGTPHKMGGNSKDGIDCSGFAHHIFKAVFHLNVPRSTELFLKAGIKISKDDLRPGDIVIFRPHSYPRHVGVYVGDNHFIHASTSKGVMLSDLDNPYWKKHYRMSRRILVSR